MFSKDSYNFVCELLWSVALCLKWVSQLSIDHVVWVGDKYFVGFLLGEAMNLS